MRDILRWMLRWLSAGPEIERVDYVLVADVALRVTATDDVALRVVAAADTEV